MANEKRLIDANLLVDWLTKSTGFRGNCENCTDIDCLDCIIEECIKNFPTVDAVEVVHGRWIQSEPGYRLCSHCMADVAIYSGHRNYCPNCGAKMDGVQG